MKKLIYILTASTVLFTTSCELVNVLEVEPPNSLVPENVVKDAESAENLLNGAYASFNDQCIDPLVFLFWVRLSDDKINTGRLSVGNPIFGAV